MLDCFATVAEVVERFSTGDLDVVSDWMPDGSRPATLHLSISDATGDSAIFEYIGGKLAIHHDRAYTVMTNSPVFEQQLALDDYWNGIGGLVFLPGTNRAADRFVRASFYIGAVPRTDDIRYAAAALTGIIRNVSVPLGIRTPNEPNISSTRWRTMADQKNRIYYYESTLDPALIRIDFGELDFGRRSRPLPRPEKEPPGAREQRRRIRSGRPVPLSGRHGRPLIAPIESPINSPKGPAAGPGDR